MDEYKSVLLNCLNTMQQDTIQTYGYMVYSVGIWAIPTENTDPAGHCFEGLNTETTAEKIKGLKSGWRICSCRRHSPEKALETLELLKHAGLPSSTKGRRMPGHPDRGNESSITTWGSLCCSKRRQPPSECPPKSRELFKPQSWALSLRE